MDTQTRLANAGIARAGQATPGLLIPIHDVAGQVRLYQYRPDSPRLNGSGKPIKYETSVGRGLVVDVPPPARDRINDPTVPLWVTEGARKADAAVTVGLCCVALLGVYGWRGTNGHGGTRALPCWESTALNGRDVLLCFDSDVMTKRDVGQALDHLGPAFYGRLQRRVDTADRGTMSRCQMSTMPPPRSEVPSSPAWISLARPSAIATCDE